MHSLLQNTLTENYRIPAKGQKSYFYMARTKTLKFYISINVFLVYFDKVARIEYPEII